MAAPTKLDSRVRNHFRGNVEALTPGLSARHIEREPARNRNKTCHSRLNFATAVPHHRREILSGATGAKLTIFLRAAFVLPRPPESLLKNAALAAIRRKVCRSVKGKTLLIAFIGLSVGSFALTYERVRSHYTCLHCRAILEKRTVAGFDRGWIEENEYSRAIRARDPQHQHQWRKSSCTYTQSFFSDSYSCGRAHPIWDVPVEAHATYARVVSAEELAATLSDLDSKDRQLATAAAERMCKTWGNAIR